MGEGRTSDLDTLRAERDAAVRRLRYLESRCLYHQPGNEALHGSVFFDVPRGKRLAEAIDDAMTTPPPE